MGNTSSKKKYEERINYELTEEGITNNGKIFKSINKEHIEKHKGHKIYFLRARENLFTTIAIDDVKNKTLYIYSFNNKNPDGDIINLFEEKKLIDTNKNSITKNHLIIIGYFDNLIAEIKYKKKLFIPFGFLYGQPKYEEYSEINGNNILLHYENNIYIWIQGLNYENSGTTKVSYNNMFKVLEFEPIERVKYFNTPIESNSGMYTNIHIVTNKYIYTLSFNDKIEIKQYLKEVERIKLPKYKLNKIWNYYISCSDVYFDKTGSTYFEPIKFPEIDFKDYNLKKESKKKKKSNKNSKSKKKSKKSNKKSK